MTLTGSLYKGESWDWEGGSRPEKEKKQTITKKKEERRRRSEQKHSKAKLCVGQ